MAAAFSIFATLSMAKLNPRKWLTWYFENCASAGGKVPADIERFLPWNLSEEQKNELPLEGQKAGGPGGCRGRGRARARARAGGGRARARGPGRARAGGPGPGPGPGRQEGAPLSKLPEMDDTS